MYKFLPTMSVIALCVFTLYVVYSYQDHFDYNFEEELENTRVIDTGIHFNAIMKCLKVKGFYEPVSGTPEEQVSKLLDMRHFCYDLAEKIYPIYSTINYSK